MPFQLQIHNPSPDPRKGFVTVPWKPIHEQTKVNPAKLVLTDQCNRELPCQIDDPEQDDSLLSFRLYDAIPGNQEAWVEMDEASTGVSAVTRDCRDRAQLELFRGDLLLSLHLHSEAPEGEAPERFAGSAQSVRFHGDEVLERYAVALGRFADMKIHDPEKRAMQIDRIWLANSPWDAKSWREVPMYDRPYHVVCVFSGPLRTDAVIATEEFNYDYKDAVSGHPERLVCRLERTITLEEGADYVLEQLRVTARPDKETAAKRVAMTFSARYFTNMDLGFHPETYRYAGQPDWFAVGAPQGHASEPHPGYGFATDAQVTRLDVPALDWVDIPTAHRTLSWDIGPSKGARCLHLFLSGTPAGFDSMTGHAWYLHIYQPLNWVTVHKGVADANAAAA